PSPPGTCAKFVGAQHDHADSPRYDPVQFVAAPFDVAEHGAMPDDPDRHSHGQRSADDVWSAFDRPGPELAGDNGLPLTNLAVHGVRAPPSAAPRAVAA